jgi:hypothetical protein
MSRKQHNKGLKVDYVESALEMVVKKPITHCKHKHLPSDSWAIAMFEYSHRQDTANMRLLSE